ncbi:MAG: PaaI family thioesterase [Burkholderiaceae bacterium]|nr:PaaI family thioesterase [Burkholderiaceae bacterium]
MNADTDPSPADTAIPPGFEPVVRGGAFFAHLAPVYRRIDGDARVLAVRIGAQHGNEHGNAHGGMLVTLADGALHDNLLRGRAPGARIVTINLCADFLSPARVGDWLEAHVSIQRQGRQLGVADCLLRVGERRVLRASATFMEPPARP